MAKLFNVKTRKQEKLSLEDTQKAIQAGTHSFRSKDSINVIDPNGESFSISGKELKQALDQGFRMESPTETSAREFARENKGISGATMTALGQFTNQAAHSIPEVILEQTGSPLDVAKAEALKKQHPIANALGGVAGFGASLFTGAPLFKAGSAAGKVAAKGLTQSVKAAGGKITEKKAAEFLTKTAANATELGVEGAIAVAPRAITEASLGDIDAAAESLLFGIGAGSILGGAFGVGSAVSKQAKDITKFGKERVELAAKKLADGQSAATKIIGATAANVEKLRKVAPDTMDRLPEFLKKIGTLKGKPSILSSNKLKKTVEEIRESSGMLIDDAADRMDKTIMNLFETGDDAIKQQIREESYNMSSLLKRIDDEFIQPNAGLAAFDSQIAPVRKLIKEIEKDIIKRGDSIITSPKELLNMRRQFDKLINFEKDPMKRSLREDALHFIRRDMQTHLTDKVAPKMAEIAPELKQAADQLVSASKDFRDSSNILPIITKKLDKKEAEKFLTFQDALLGGAGAGIGGVGGLITGAASRRGINYLDNATDVIGLLWAEKAMNKAAKALDTVSGVLKKSDKVTGKLSTGSSVSAMSRFLGEKEGSRSRREQFRKISEQLAAAGANQQPIIQQITQVTEPIAEAGAPNVGEQLAAKLHGSLTWLENAIPKPPQADIPFFTPRPWEPSDAQLGKFERQLEVMMDPFVVIRDFKNGSLTRDQMEVIDDIYPTLGQAMRQKVMNTLAEEPQAADFNDRMKLSLLLGIDLDVNITPQFVRRYQATFVPAGTEQAVVNDFQTNPGRMQTDANRVATDVDLNQ